jgi:GMP synthase (glutamine-hydrolysing)
LSNDTNKILAVVHHGASDLGRVGPILRDAGYEFEICWPVEGDTLPARLSDYAGVTIFGGIMGAYDDHLPGIAAELDWIPKVVQAGCPMFGICLGAQLIAHALGGRAYKQRQGLWEIGYFPVEPTAAGGHVLPNGAQHFFSWHQDGFDIPAGAELLGTGGEAFPNQIFRFGETTYAVQFHPEAPSDLFTSWMKNAPQDFDTRPGAHPRRRQVEDAKLYEDAADAWLTDFLHMWLRGRALQADANTG